MSATPTRIELDLRDNVNPWGSPPAALRTLATFGSSCARIDTYPEADAHTLRSAIARSVGIDTSEVVVGCGSDDLIDASMRALARPGDTVAHLSPTFGMVSTFARANSLVSVAVPLSADGSADIDGLLSTGARLTYLCSPNNPTGGVTSGESIGRLLAEARGVVLLDEAYAEFADGAGVLATAPSRGNVLVFRTFSKAWGLAGLRAGYAVGERSLVASVAHARGPYKVNTVACRAATAAMTEDAGWMHERAAEARMVRDILTAALRERPRVHPWTSHGNFVFAATDDPAAVVAERFAALGIAVRAFANLDAIGPAVRLGLVTRDTVPRMLQAFEEVWPCE